MFCSLMEFLFCSNQKIGMAYINHLVEKGDYDTAARYYSLLVLSVVFLLQNTSTRSRLSDCFPSLSLSFSSIQEVSEGAG